ncbi:MAG: hypothetical protein NTY77_05160 [Elusimicrobia bacterium]|nr:hypothetical protein [Elusimicrobiota bacterium]
MNRPLTAIVLWVWAGSASAGQGELAETVAWFKASVPAARKVVAPPANAAALSSAARVAVKVYDEHLPAAYRKAIANSARPAWNEMNAWYRMASQEVMLMAKEAERLSQACKTLDDRTQAGAAAQAALESARGFLRFIDETPWPEPLRPPMTHEVRAAQVRAIERWRALADCCAPKPSR